MPWIGSNPRGSSGTRASLRNGMIEESKGNGLEVHRTPRVAMFTPFRVRRGPGRKTRLQSVRQTIRVDEKGHQFDVVDDWTDKAHAHRALPARWTGITISEPSLVTIYFTEEINGDSENEITTLCCLRPQETEMLNNYFRSAQSAVT